jgi:hypothetical protein
MDAEIQNCSTVEELISKFKVDDLKSYLRDRALNLSGDKRCLAKKVFGACKLQIPKAATELEDEIKKNEEKKEKLCLEDGIIKLPQPCCLKAGWVAGSSHFPDTFEEDVEKYLKDKAPKALLKGASLEESKHVKDVAFHTISPNLKYCFVRGNVIPQEKTNNNPYKAWVCLKKSDGSVVTAECSCIAG